MWFDGICHIRARLKLLMGLSDLKFMKKYVVFLVCL